MGCAECVCVARSFSAISVCVCVLLCYRTALLVGRTV